MDPQRLGQLIKQLDERRSRAKTLDELFDDDVTVLHQEVVEHCEEAMFCDQDSVSSRPREILWRKGYYDTIALAKRFIHKHLKSRAALDDNNKQSPTSLAGMDELCAFIEEGIARLKSIIIRIDQDYDLDLKYVVDFSLFKSPDAGEVVALEHDVIPINKKITSLEIISFALESIHAVMVSLGDLHRYCLDFGLHKGFDCNVTPELTARFYEAAFQLNPKHGMPQNQLGTLWIGRNHNLDSVYHYLYSLVCAKPFALSQDNVLKIFAQGAAYLEALVMPEDYTVNVRDFIARFLLVVDIFFFDKNVPTLNDLCRFLLCDLNLMLRQKDPETGESVLQQDLLFKLTSILFFCLHRLKELSSPKVFPLNAFLAAICNQMVEVCNLNLDTFIQEHAEEDAEYKERYQKLFDMYHVGRTDLAQNVLLAEDVESRGQKPMTSSGMSGASTGGGNTPLTGASGERLSKKPRASVAQAKKRAVKYRRRRRRSTYSTDSDLTSNFDTDSEASADEDSTESSDDSDDGEEDDFYGDKPAVRRTSTNDYGDSDSDVLIEEETMVMVNQENVPENQQNDTDVGVEDLKTDFLEMTIGDSVANDGSRRERARQKLASDKHNPNLLLQFVDQEPTIRALKLLLDWLMDHKEIVRECNQSNPEFLHKIMSLMNTLNLDIFTRRVFFQRELLTVDGLREDIKGLFEVRGKLPIAEDLCMKHFGEFSKAQAGLDWELSAQMAITPMEENLMRIVKLKNFGFFICDRKKFGFVFRNCEFKEVDVDVSKKMTKKVGGGQQPGRDSLRKKEGQGRQRKRGQQPIGDRNGTKTTRKDPNNTRRVRGSVRDEGSGDAANKQEMKVLREKEMLKKGELMGKLWLRNEVKTLESKARGPKNMLTPYVVVDTQALMQHLSIAKHFVNMKKFIVLIPIEVLRELDVLKTTHDRARECIRWLDKTISNGSPFLKTQELREKLPLRDYVKPRHQGMRSPTSGFVDIAEFCHFLAKKHEIDGQSEDVLTLLTGEDLLEKDIAIGDCDYVQVLRSIPVKFDRIDKFYGKLIKK